MSCFTTSLIPGPLPSRHRLSRPASLLAEHIAGDQGNRKRSLAQTRGIPIFCTAKGIRHAPRSTKTLTSLGLHLTVGFTVAHAMTGSLALAGGIALVEPGIDAVAFRFHERAWKRFDAASANVENPGFPALHPA
ncbi:MAG: DUF2061 domain-containing protein [Novosphingobium sp.]|nr:DUF2061 domain-containing protein [Novosphingobium sp.]